MFPGGEMFPGWHTGGKKQCLATGYMKGQFYSEGGSVVQCV
jgi:hypothetical protein